MRQKGILNSFALNEWSASDLAKSSEELIEKTQTAYEKVGALKQDEVTFETCIKVKMFTF
jgi:hypothetical protein